MDMNKAEPIKYPVSAISRLRIGTDGQGVRTLIALAGCTLKCKYCLNRFTWDGSHIPNLYTVEELYKIVSKDLIYMLATNGGITFGGGEPLMYPKLIKEFRDICDAGLNINVETALNIPRENVALIADLVDEFTIDIKTMNRKQYKKYTGVGNEQTIDNIKWLIEKGYAEKLKVRVPVIPDYADEASQAKSVEALKKLGIQWFDCFEYKKFV